MRGSFPSPFFPRGPFLRVQGLWSGLPSARFEFFKAVCLALTPTWSDGYRIDMIDHTTRHVSFHRLSLPPALCTYTFILCGDVGVEE